MVVLKATYPFYCPTITVTAPVVVVVECIYALKALQDRVCWSDVFCRADALHGNAGEMHAGITISTLFSCQEL